MSNLEIIQSPANNLVIQQGIKGDKGDAGVNGVGVPLSSVYPVGCIYTTTVSTNPNTIFGFGTWSAFGSGRCLVGVDTGQTEFDTVEETGGAKTHTLTISEMPAHTHTETRNVANAVFTTPGGSGMDGALTVNTGSTGGGQAHNNLQPYITVYFWKRTA